MNPGAQRSALERFAAKLKFDPATECHVWTGAVQSRGYGSFGVDGKVVLAHRFSWEVARGPVPEGLTLDHLCRNRLCVNPAHLEPVPNRINVLRGAAPSAENARKTHCSFGHELAGTNIKLRRGRRECLVCKRRMAREGRLRTSVMKMVAHA